MHFLSLIDHRRFHGQWRSVTLTVASVALFALTVVFGQPLGWPIALRALLAAGAGVGLATGQRLRGRRA